MENKEAVKSEKPGINELVSRFWVIVNILAGLIMAVPASGIAETCPSEEWEDLLKGKCFSELTSEEKKRF